MVLCLRFWTLTQFIVTAFVYFCLFFFNSLLELKFSFHPFNAIFFLRLFLASLTSTICSFFCFSLLFFSSWVLNNKSINAFFFVSSDLVVLRISYLKCMNSVKFLLICVSIYLSYEKSQVWFGQSLTRKAFLLLLAPSIKTWWVLKPYIK